MSCETALQTAPPSAPDIETFFQVAAAALIDPDNRILITQRPAGKWMEGYWEFPGGKIEPGEVPEFALMRELREELGIETRPSCFSPIAFASHTYEDKKTHVLMPLYACRFWHGTPRGAEGQALKWVNVPELYQIGLLPADVPLIPLIENYL
jgi:8-oxo-dGTP diphosphatase